MKKYKQDIIFFGSLAVFIVIFYFLAVVVLPFFIGLAFAYVFNPLIKRIQKRIPNRNLAVTAFLISVLIVTVGTTWLFANQISNDFKRLSSSFRTYTESNKEMLDETTAKIKSYIEKVYSPEDLKKQLGLNDKDSMDDYNSQEILNGLDTETIKESFAVITSFFSSEDDEEKTDSGLNWFIIILSSMVYFVYIIYTLHYFDTKFQRYFSGKHSQKMKRVIDDFKISFLSYFKQRSIIVLIYTLIYITAFFIIGVPGALILGIIAGLLCFIPYFQYITLIPLSVGCLILSMEHGNSFFVYFGIVLAVFILSSVLEELVLFPKIMKGVSAMNPAIMMISVSVWGYLFGVLGVLIALPLTSLSMSYIKQVLLYKDRLQKT